MERVTSRSAGLLLVVDARGVELRSSVGASTVGPNEDLPEPEGSERSSGDWSDGGDAMFDAIPNLEAEAFGRCRFELEDVEPAATRQREQWPSADCCDRPRCEGEQLLALVGSIVLDVHHGATLEPVDEPSVIWSVNDHKVIPAGRVHQMVEVSDNGGQISDGAVVIAAINGNLAVSPEGSG